jgi:hypothetical protein
MTSATAHPSKIDLTTFFLSIASAAYMGLENEPNLELAKQNIDLLELMQTKTKGNRSEEEDHLIDQLLLELRLRFVGKTKTQKI